MTFGERVVKTREQSLFVSDVEWYVKMQIRDSRKRQVAP